MLDINYLLLLQNFREATNNFFSPFLLWLSDFVVGFWPFAVMFMIYWIFDRKAGKRLISGFSLGLLANGILKLTFCIYRPWVRDARVLPYGNAKVLATGYSFPSGHSTWATTLYGGMGWWQRNKRRWLMVLLFAAVALTMFSRNYLGVHTPQDVLVGFASSVILMFAAAKIENWSDENPKRDLYVLIGGVFVALAAFLYFQLKPYPLDYLEDGSLRVDPLKMKADSFQGIGIVLSYSICRFFERRSFDFEAELHWKDRFIIGTLALIPFHYWCTHAVSWGTKLVNRDFGMLLFYSMIPVYAMIIVPAVMKLIKTKVLDRNS